jgi:hypothetical protein
MAYLYEVFVFVERGWWVVDVSDIGARARVATLSEVDAAARAMIRHRLGLTAQDFSVDIRVMRRVPEGVTRVRWRHRMPFRPR